MVVDAPRTALNPREISRLEALSLLDRAEPMPRCRLTRAAIAFADGDDDATTDHAATFLRQSPVGASVE